MRFLVLVVVLLAAAWAFADGVKADDRLRLELGTDRLWCTAGTEVQAIWDVGGGEPPYAVTVQGEEMTVGPRLTSRLTGVPCDGLPAEAADDPLARGEMMIRAEVVDAAGSRASAEARVLIAPPLPAPTGLRLEPRYIGFVARFELVTGAGSLMRLSAESEWSASYVLRHRVLGELEWEYETQREDSGRIDFEPEAGVVGEMQVAAMRHWTEARRPEALIWSEIVRYSASEAWERPERDSPRKPVELVAVTAREDRIAVRTWAPDGYDDLAIELQGADGSVAAEYAAGERLITHYAVFEGVTPNSPYVLRVPSYAGEPMTFPIVTVAEVEPFALRLGLPTGSCTVGTETDIRWQVLGGIGPYEGEIAGRAAEGAEGTVRIACGATERNGRADRFGYVRRILRGTVSDAGGSVAGAEAVLLVGPALAPPRLDPPQASLGRGFEVGLDLPVADGLEQTWRIAMRWRMVGSADWEYQVDEITTSWDSYGDLAVTPRANGRTSWSNGDKVVVSPSDDGGWPSATRFEMQLALLRDVREVERPHVLRWGDIAYVTTASDPIGLEAVSTHDSILLRWGPAVADLEFSAALDPWPSEAEMILDSSRQITGRVRYTVSEGKPYEITWHGLCPATAYYASVRPVPSFFGDPSLGLLITTELEPGRSDGAPFVEATAVADKIILRWVPGACVPESRYRVELAEYGGLITDEFSFFEREDDAHEISGLTPGSTYQIIFKPTNYSRRYWDRADNMFTVVVVETPERDSDSAADGEPPEFTVRYDYIRSESYWDEPTFRVELLDGEHDLVEIEWHVDGRRVRRLVRSWDAPHDIKGLPPGWYEFRVRGIDAEGHATRWSEAIRAVTLPFTPPIRSVRYERDFLILTWDEPYDEVLVNSEVPVDRYLIEWRTDDGDWESAMVGSGDWGAIPSAPFMSGGTWYLRLRPVSDEYGAGKPSAEWKVPSPHQDLRMGMDARGCAEGESGIFSVAWIFHRGVAPFKIRLRPINLAPDGAGVTEIITSDHQGRVGLPCADGAEEHEGRLHASVGVQISEYGRQLTAEQIQRVTFGYMDKTYSDYYGRSFKQTYEPFPAPEHINLNVGSTAIRWMIGPAGCLVRRDRGVVRMRSAGNEDWVERKPYGAGPDKCFSWRLGGLQPATRYEYAFGRYTALGVEWSETGMVTTLGPVTGIAVSEWEDSVVVEWDAQAFAWRYVVRLRGTGRSWWGLHEATEGEREPVEFAGAAEYGPYTAEVITPPIYKYGNEASKFDQLEGP